MKYLLDTHVVLWIAESSPRLSSKVRGLAEKSDADDFGVAAISLLEIARKAQTGEIDLSPDGATWLDDLAHRFRILPLTPKIAWRSVQLDWEHKDPADRLICATALEHKLTLVTHDKEIIRWAGVTVLW
ncbi:MAG: type II toxin-antitoxin system VapC family toxin [Opitutaceae bacterium]|nr:type II toxin-antitoxin system VapC family toxin [Opitutaceae bacterium]